MSTYRLINHEGKQIEFYETLGRFLDHTTVEKWRNTRDRYYDLETDDSWGGGLTISQAHETARSGIGFTPQMIQFRERLLASVCVARTEQAYWDTAGAEINMGAYLNGEPECMLDYRQDTGKARVKLILVVKLDCASVVGVERLQQRGVAYMALIDALEMSGLYSVRLFCYASTDRDPHTVLVQLKDEATQYDPSAVAFAMAHPSFYRRLVFGDYDIAVGENRRGQHASWRNGYSSAAASIDLPPELTDGCIVHSASGCYYSLREFATEEQSERWVLDTLHNLGVQTQDANQ